MNTVRVRYRVRKNVENYQIGGGQDLLDSSGLGYESANNNYRPDSKINSVIERRRASFRNARSINFNSNLEEHVISWVIDSIISKIDVQKDSDIQLNDNYIIERAIEKSSNRIIVMKNFKGIEFLLLKHNSTIRLASSDGELLFSLNLQKRYYRQEEVYLLEIENKSYYIGYREKILILRNLSMLYLECVNYLASEEPEAKDNSLFQLIVDVMPNITYNRLVERAKVSQIIPIDHLKGWSKKQPREVIEDTSDTKITLNRDFHRWLQTAELEK